MDHKNDLQLSRLRSSRSIIADGYRLYTNSFRKIFRLSWIAGLIYAVILSFQVSHSLEMIPYFMMAMQSMASGQGLSPELISQYQAQNSISMGLSLLLLISMALLVTLAYQAFRQHRQDGVYARPAHWYTLPDMNLFGRLILTYLFFVIISVICCIPIIAGVFLIKQGTIGPISGGIAITFFLLLLAVLLLPFIYSVQKYLIDAKPSFSRRVGHDYLVGWRYWGRIFAVALIVGIITTSVSFIIELPSPILSMAYLSSQRGVAIGDPTGMPEYMSWMKYVVFILAGFIQSFVILSSFFPIYYLYGSIEASEQDRKQPNQSL